MIIKTEENGVISFRWKIAQTGSIAPRGVRLMTQIFKKFDFAGFARNFLPKLLQMCLKHSSNNVLLIQEVGIRIVI